MTVSVSRWLSVTRLIAALTVFGIVLGTATLVTTAANAAFPSFGFQGDNQGAGS
jgi:hypothetical protein